MANYKFEQFKLELINPTISINPIVREVNPLNMTISVEVILTTPNGSKKSVTLNGVQVVDLNYNAEQLTERVMAKLQEFEVVTQA